MFATRHKDKRQQRAWRPSTALTGLTLVLCLALTACGSSDPPTIASVGKTKITRATLSHWMETVVGGDYFQITGKRAPYGIASDPADYGACIRALRKIAAEAEVIKHYSTSELHQKCVWLAEAIKEQALSYIINVLWVTEQAGELNAKVSEHELRAHLQGMAREKYSSPAGFRKYLADNHRTVADELFLLKRNLLDTKVLTAIEAKAKAAGGGEAVFHRIVEQNLATRTKRTSCSPGYVSWECKQYKPKLAAPVSAGIILERLSKGKAA